MGLYSVLPSSSKGTPLIAHRLTLQLDPATRLFGFAFATALFLSLAIALKGEWVAALVLPFALMVIGDTRMRRVSIRALLHRVTVFQQADGQMSFLEPEKSPAKKQPKAVASGRPEPAREAEGEKPVAPQPTLFDAVAHAERAARPEVITSAWLLAEGKAEDLSPYLQACLAQADTSPSSMRAIRGGFAVLDMLRSAEPADFESKDAMYAAIAEEAAKGVDVVKKIALGTYPPLESRLANIDPKTLKLRQIPG